MLSDAQRREFAQDGFVVLRGVVSEELLRDVDAEVDRLVEGSAPPPGTAGPHFWFLPPSTLRASDAALRASPALSLANELVAPNTVDHALGHIQLALNVPPYPHVPGAPHIDGHRPEDVRPHTFTMLGAIYLSDETEADRGNLWVWPGSHRMHARALRERGTMSLLPVSGHGCFLDPPLEYGPAHPVLARRGDLLLAHFLLGHNTGGNTSATIRRIAYYRLACPDHRDHWEASVTDPLHEYPTLRQFVGDVGAQG